MAVASRSPSEVGLEVVREPHRLKDCGVVPAELRERHLHLGDGSGQGGVSGSSPLVPFAGVVHLLLKTGLDGRLQRILLSTPPLLQTSQTAPCVENIVRQRRRAAPRRINGYSGPAHEQPGDAGRQDSEGEGIGHAAIVQAVSGVEAEFLRRPEELLRILNSSSGAIDAGEVVARGESDRVSRSQGAGAVFEGLLEQFDGFVEPAGCLIGTGERAT